MAPDRTNDPDDDRFGWPDDARDRRTSDETVGRDGAPESSDRREPAGRRGTSGDERSDVPNPGADPGQQAIGGRRPSSQAGGPGRVLRVAGLEFTRRELLDLAVAWVALGLAFAFFFFGRGVVLDGLFALSLSLGVSMATVGVGFLLHELAHKVVAVTFGQVAHFRADYGMLLLAIIAGLGGFLFAAPGAVYHRGRITPRENGLIAVAGPVTNVLLVVPFLPLAFLPGLPGLVGQIGVAINAVLAAFNMIPFGPLDGRTVLSWSKTVYVPVFLVTLALAAASLAMFFGLI